MLSFNPLGYPRLFSDPKRTETGTFAWMGHVPFAMFLIEATRPRVVVELGTHKGVSYCAFCQAVAELKLGTRCTAVDTWRGDSHAGDYGDEVFADLKRHHDPLYSRFSTLLRGTFDEALTHFADASIDILHIDGFHTYEAVKQDYETWLPKMSDRGVILFHDTVVREGDFGVWKLWEEISRGRTAFEMPHSHGLGVLVVGTHCPAELKRLLELPEPERASVREFFAHQGNQLVAAQQNGEKLREIERTARKFRLTKTLALLTILSEEGARSLRRKVVSGVRRKLRRAR